MYEEKRTSPWVWVGVGCLGAVVVAVMAVVAVGWFGYRKVKQLEAELKDPKARAAKVQGILGADKLPEGYHAVVGMSVPYVMEMAILSDRPPESSGRQHGLGTRGFIYMRMLSPDSKRQELRDYFEGKTDDPEVLRRNNIRIERHGEVLRRGVLDLPPELKLMYLAQRGTVEMSDSRAKGIMTMMLLECERSDDNRQRMAFWFGPDPAPETPDNELSLAGTPADESALRDVMGHFRLCSAR